MKPSLIFPSQGRLSAAGARASCLSRPHYCRYLPRNCILVKMDVAAIYTNIPSEMLPNFTQSAPYTAIFRGHFADPLTDALSLPSAFDFRKFVSEEVNA